MLYFSGEISPNIQKTGLISVIVPPHTIYAHVMSMNIQYKLVVDQTKPHWSSFSMLLIGEARHIIV